MANLSFSLASIFSSKPLRRVALQNRMKDYQNLLNNQDSSLWDYHLKINQILAQQTAEYDSYDYGEGYFYQGFEKTSLSGFRNTTERVNNLDLKARLKDKSVIDIGCNAGFLLLHLADDIKSGYGFDINPFMIEVANTTKDYLKITNCHFDTTAFEDLDATEQQFDAVLSLANHSTYDNNTKQSIDEYFKHAAALLKPKGHLIFESHPPQLEDQQRIRDVKQVIGRYFDINEEGQFDFSGFLDKNRTYFFASKK